MITAPMYVFGNRRLQPPAAGVGLGPVAPFLHRSLRGLGVGPRVLVGVRQPVEHRAVPLGGACGAIGDGSWGTAGGGSRHA